VTEIDTCVGLNGSKVERQCVLIADKTSTDIRRFDRIGYDDER
jgi:hypothetical protein